MAMCKEIIDELLGDASTAEDLFGQEGILKILLDQLMDVFLMDF